jgi:hypothetical protein
MTDHELHTSWRNAQEEKTLEYPEYLPSALGEFPSSSSLPFSLTDATFEADVASDPTIAEEVVEVEKLDDQSIVEQLKSTPGATGDQIRDYMLQIAKVPLLRP